MLSRAFNIIGKRVRAFLPIAVCTGLFCYFLIHFAGGEHGLEARDRLGLRVAALQTELNELNRERRSIEQKLALLENPARNADLIDELARKSLQYARPDDLVIFD